MAVDVDRSSNLYRFAPVWRQIVPYGMREVPGLGKNVWEFFNRDYNVIGAPFRLLRKPSLKQLESVSCTGGVRSYGDEAQKVFFYTGHPDAGAYSRIAKVGEWKTSGEVDVGLPHTYQNKQ